jgi:hypothetical protein
MGWHQTRFAIRGLQDEDRPREGVKLVLPRDEEEPRDGIKLVLPRDGIKLDLPFEIYEM